MVAFSSMGLRSTRELRFLEVAAERIGEASRAYDDIVAGRLTGVIVRAAFDAAALAAGAERLITDTRIPSLTFESSGAAMIQIFGCPTQLANGDLGEHYRKAELCSTAIREAFGPDYDLEGRLRAVLSAVASQRPTRRLPHRSGYSPAIGAVNLHTAGGWTPHHFDTLFFEIPHFRSLRPHLDSGLLVNANFPLERALGGGDLEFFAYDWAAFQNDFPGAGRDELTARFVPGEFECRRVELDVGDILIFDAGRTVHSVTAVPPGKRRMNFGLHTSFEPGRESIVYFT